MVNKKIVLAGLCFLGAWSAAGPARADILLTDGGASVVIDPATQAGVKNWQVGGANQLYQQAFWYRIGSGMERGFSSISAPVVTQLADNIAQVVYNGNGLNVRIIYALAGGSTSSDLSEVISIRNTGSARIDLSVFQYADFDLNGTPGNDTIQFLGNNHVLQREGGVAMAETVVDGFPSHHEANLASALLSKLSDNLTTTLSDGSGPLLGDVAWSFQWNRSLRPGETFNFSKDMNLLIPAPGAALLGTLGLSALRALRRRMA